jgi:hypothetical protein
MIAAPTGCTLLSIGAEQKEARCFVRIRFVSGAISGVVTDSTGAIVPGAKVTITETDTNVQVVSSTNDSGFYSAPSLHPGPTFC